jgi:TrmH family RNA methyltransferase
MPSLKAKFILVRPRDPNNIGAVARAMKNFGFTELAVVAPYLPNWNEAVSAVNALDVLAQAQVYASLADAIADCTWVVGTADRTRITDQQVIYTPLDLRHEFANTQSKLALVFGPEKHGLTKEDLSYCHRIMSLPTAPDCPSMNLGQAVAICCYELRPTFAADTTEALAAPSCATAGEVEASLQLLLTVLREAEFLRQENEASMTHKLRQHLLRLSLTRRETTLLCGALRQIQWRFEKN